jgi:hypothetical protein
MNVNPLLDYHLIDIIDEMNASIINTKLKRFGINKKVSDTMINNEKEKGKTSLKVVKIVFDNFLKKYNKQGLDRIHRKFIKQGLTSSQDDIYDMYNTFNNIKNKTGKNHDYYVFFD